MLGRVALTLARLAVSGWIGAAVLFVVTSIHEVRDERFDSATRDTLAALRFPDYYRFGFALVGLGFLAAAAALGRAALRRRRALFILGLLAVALALMSADYLWIYRSITDMIDPPGNPKPANFERMHLASESINTLHVGVCLIAALLLNWPQARAPRGDKNNA
jgi:hypothetical protein